MNQYISYCPECGCNIHFHAPGCITGSRGTAGGGGVAGGSGFGGNPAEQYLKDQLIQTQAETIRLLKSSERFQEVIRHHEQLIEMLKLEVAQLNEENRKKK